MTQRKPLPKIARCGCGRKARLTEYGRWRKACRARCTLSGCWIGPFRKTKRGAINAWNLGREISRAERLGREVECKETWTTSLGVIR